MRAPTFLQTLRLVLQYQRYTWIHPRRELEAKLEHFFYDPRPTTTGNFGLIARPLSSPHSIRERREPRPLLKCRRHFTE